MWNLASAHVVVEKILYQEKHHTGQLMVMMNQKNKYLEKVVVKMIIV